MRPSSSVFPALALALVVGACGASDSPAEPGIDDKPEGSTTPTVKPDPSFATDIVPIFSREGCTFGGCHGAPIQANLNLSSSPYTALVNVPSSQTAELRVIPGNAIASYLVKKLEGRASVGERMPVGTQLSATDLTNIKNWINQGAKNN
ncbi:MAG: hypothetical protein Q8N53_10885 [Longimicrobiales bacterium]|nr:hypothetical protein [Longimicrobiales bacterium]